MIDKGVVQLCRKDYSNTPTDHDKQQYANLLEEHAKTYNDFYCESKLNRSKQMIDKILDGKRKKVAKTGGNPDEVTEEAVLDDIKKNCIANLDNIYVQIPTQDPFDVG